MNNSHNVDGNNFDKVFDEVQDLLQDYYTSGMSQPQSRQSGKRPTSTPVRQSLLYQTQRFERVSVKIPSQESAPHGRSTAKQKRAQKRSRMIPRLLTVVFILVLLVSLGMLIGNHLRLKKEQEAFEKLAQQVSQAASQYAEEKSLQSSQTEGVTPEPQPKTKAYQILYDQNPDFIGWLKVNNTIIDYPVMYTPGDPEYYLRRAFDGSYSLSGSLFIGNDCFPDGTNIIIYGHNMNDGSMFGHLDSYADEEYAKTHPEIIYDLIQPDGSYEQITFKVMAAFYSRVYSLDEENVFRYYYSTDLSEPDEFHYYIEEVISASLYDLGVMAEYGDRLLTLSTCSYHTENGRFVVVAREEHAK